MYKKKGTTAHSSGRDFGLMTRIKSTKKNKRYSRARLTVSFSHSLSEKVADFSTCIQSMLVSTKFKCVICLETIRNKFVPLGKDLLDAKLNYLQRGGGCCKKSEKK